MSYIKETSRIFEINSGKERIGYFPLSRLAFTHNMTVKLLDEELIPEFWDEFGQPHFTAEQYFLYRMKEAEIRKKTGDSTFVLEAEIYYKEQPFKVPREKFDTVHYLKKATESFTSLSEFLKCRRLFCFANPDEELRKFVIFKRYLLDEKGNVRSLPLHTYMDFIFTSNLEDYSSFRQNNGNINCFSSNNDIPNEKEYCPCCGKYFSIKDLNT